MLPRIEEILKIEGHKITCQWNTGEVKTIDFDNLVEINSDGITSKIFAPGVFDTVKVDPISKTLYWDNLLPYTDYDGQTKLGLLDFCPDVLYKTG
ncbi:MAG TPA: hypothetical protein VEC12_03305 [Bacteroidia bacterium]|nr:hypothetical protein [Bacteroidia bacterium]